MDKSESCIQETVIGIARLWQTMVLSSISQLKIMKLPGSISTVCLLSLVTCCLNGQSGGVHILEDFDGNADPEVVAVSEGQLVDVDGNDEREGRFVTRNFARVIQIKLEPGGDLLNVIREFPVLAYDVAAVPGRNKGTFLQTQVQIATDYKNGVYDIFPASQIPLPRSGKAVTVRLNLLEAKTKGGVELKDVLEAFASGECRKLNIAITQQSSRDAETDCVYDNIRLERAG